MQVLPLIYSSERPNTRATHIQCCPGQPREFRLLSPTKSLLTELGPRLLSAMSGKTLIELRRFVKS